MVVLFIFYGSIVFFIIASIVCLNGFLKAPVHLRWEIHRDNPVYEPSKHTDIRPVGIQKFKETIVDILFLRGYYQNQRSFWLPLFAFHMGAYLLFLWHVWLFATALIGVSPYPRYVLFLGHGATLLAFIGGFGVLAQRVFQKKLKTYYSVYHYFKWILILALLAQGYLVVYSHFGNDMTAVTAYVTRQLSFDWGYKLNSPAATSLHVILVSAWLIYLPFGHVARLVFRYYHELRQEFVNNSRNSALPRTISQNLNRPITWSASHIGPGGTWAGVVENNPRSHVGESDE